MRIGGLALIAGGIALLVAVIVLWRMTRVPHDLRAGVPSSEVPTTDVHAEVAGGTKPTGTPATARRTGTIPVPKPGEPAPAAGTNAPANDSPVLTPGGDTGEKKRVPIASLPVLREAVATLDGAVADCVHRFGQGVSGTANLSFIVAANKNKVEIESTGVIEDGTTITNEDLLACMHKTAQSLKFPFVADAQAVFARRVARVDNGKLVDQHIVNFSYIP